MHGSVRRRASNCGPVVRECHREERGQGGVRWYDQVHRSACSGSSFATRRGRSSGARARRCSGCTSSSPEAAEPSPGGGCSKASTALDAPRHAPACLSDRDEPSSALAPPLPLTTAACLHLARLLRGPGRVPDRRAPAARHGGGPARATATLLPLLRYADSSLTLCTVSEPSCSLFRARQWCGCDSAVLQTSADGHTCGSADHNQRPRTSSEQCLFTRLFVC